MSESDSPVNLSDPLLAVLQKIPVGGKMTRREIAELMRSYWRRCSPENRIRLRGQLHRAGYSGCDEEGDLVNMVVHELEKAHKLHQPPRRGAEWWPGKYSSGPSMGHPHY